MGIGAELYTVRQLDCLPLRQPRFAACGGTGNAEYDMKRSSVWPVSRPTKPFHRDEYFGVLCPEESHGGGRAGSFHVGAPGAGCLERFAKLQKAVQLPGVLLDC